MQTKVKEYIEIVEKVARIEQRRIPQHMVEYEELVSIGVIAPGLAVALGTTALGLIAAVPAAIAYNVFSKKSDDLYDALDDAVKEMKHK